MKKQWLVAAGWVMACAIISLRAEEKERMVVDGPPLVRTWMPAVYPPELKAAGVTGSVRVRFSVDEKGVLSGARAVESSDPRFEEAAVTAVSQWTFDAGVANGALVATGMEVMIYFKLPEPKPGLMPPKQSNPLPAPITEAKADDVPRPEYPPELLARKIGGKGVVGFIVQPDGRITDPELLGVSHPGFAHSVLKALETLRFTPALQGDLPIAARIVSPMEFDPEFVVIGDAGASHLELNGLALRVTEGQTARQLCTRPPELWSVPDPIYPRAAALAGIAGEAVAEFDVDERGNVVDVRVISATIPEFGQALEDALAAGTFRPAVKDGRMVAVPLRWTYVFKQPEAEPLEDETPELRLIRLLRSGQTIEGPKGLDEKIKMLWRVMPDYPKAMRGEATAGSATIELIVDRTGRARLPFVVSASHEAFGRAALVAASRWVFAPPLRGGRPADVRVRLPFNFAP